MALAPNFKEGTPDVDALLAAERVLLASENIIYFVTLKCESI